MKICIKKNNTTLLCALFAIWLICELAFSYSMLSRLSLLFFVGATIVCTQKLRWTYCLTGYALFILWSFLNIVSNHATDRQTAMDMTQTLCLNLLFLMALTSFCAYIGNTHSVLQIYMWIIICCAIPCLIGGVVGIIQTGERPLSIMGINSNEIAMQAAYAAIILINEILNTPCKQRKLSSFAFITVLVLLILVSGSRKGLLIPVIGIYVLVCFRKPRKFVFYTLAIVLVSGIVLYLIMSVDTLYNIIGYRVEALLQYFFDEEYDEASLVSRAYYVQLGWEKSQNSIVWGHGLDCFRLLPRTGTYSHSNYIEILYSLGWTGVAFYYYPYLRALLQIPSAIPNDRRMTALTVALLIPYLVCDYMNVTYFTRLALMIPVVLIRQISEAKNIQ